MHEWMDAGQMDDKQDKWMDTGIINGQMDV